MTDGQGTPVYLEGEGALLPNGTFLPEEALRAAVDAVTAFCRWIESLPVEARIALEVEAVFADAFLHPPEDR